MEPVKTDVAGLTGWSVLTAVTCSVTLVCAGCLDWKIDDSAVPDGDGDADADVDCVESPCDLWPQCGCPSGETCELTIEGNRACQPVGPAGLGEVCDGDHECGLGLTCLGAIGEPRFCRQYCQSDDDCPGIALCLIEIGLDLETWGTTCTSACDPASTSPNCPPGVRCYIYDHDAPPVFFGHCLGTAGGGTRNTRCAGNDDCASGYFCADVGMANLQCVRICTRPLGEQCVDHERCNSFPEPISIEGLEYGYCL